MNVAIYARVSSDRQDVDLSISAQRGALRDHVERNGDTVVREYIDEAESGRSADRPEFQRMVSDAKRSPRPFDAVLVWKFSRFARNREDSILYKNLLRKHGVRIVSITEPADASPAGQLFEAMIESVDEFYSANLSQEIRRGMRESASRGFLVHSGAPFGYRRIKVLDGTTPRATLEVDPVTAPVVVRMFDGVMKGQGLKEIAKHLNADGLMRRGSKPWTTTSIHKILSNEVYTGMLVWGRTSSAVSGASDPIRVENAFPALVDHQTFVGARERLHARAPRVVHPRRASSRYLLSGLLRCGNCEKTMGGNRRRVAGIPITSATC